MNKTIHYICLLTCFAWNVSFGQTIVNLDEISSNTSYGTSYTTPDGMVFSLDGDGASEFVGLDYIGHENGKGIDIVIVSDAITTLTIARDDAGYFTFSSIYLRDGFGDADITVDGFDGATKTNTAAISMFMLDDVYNFDWSGVNRITISSSDLSLAFDKITYAAIYPLFEDDLADGTDAIAIDENTSVSSDIYDVNANDGNGGGTDSNLTYSIVSGNFNPDGDGTSAFSINTSTGVVSVADSDDLDRETTESFELTVQADNGINAATATLTINLNDINDVAPAITESQTFNIDEHANNATSVGTVIATDADISATTFQDWTIVEGNTDDAFVIDSETGVITVNNNSNLDRETIVGFTLTITVSDGLHPSKPETVEVLLTDINDETPVITEDQSFSIAENSNNTTSVGTLTATDADISATTFQAWTITSGNTDGAFSVNASTGEITVTNQDALDRETINVFELSITVSDGFNTSLPETVTIELIDINEYAPVITPDLTFTVNEGLPSGAVIGAITATDSDDDAALQSWSIVSGNTNDVFDLNISTGEITVSGDGNFADQASYELKVTVSDGLFISDSETIEILVNYKPIFTEDSYNVNISEDAPVGSTLIVIEATDPESTSISYSISNVNQNDLFEINASTGEITTIALLDAGNPAHSIEITATDEDGLTQVATVHITVDEFAITGIEDYNDMGVIVYPNPSAGRFTIEAPDQASLAVRLFDLKANLVTDLGDFQFKKEIDISSYQQGVYYLRISNQEQTFVKKIIIAK